LKEYACAAVLLAAGLWAYGTSFEGAFVFDDFISVVQNPHVRTLRPVTAAMSAPPDTTLSGRPVASLSFALNYALAPTEARETFEPPPAGRDEDAAPFRRNVRAYHAVNLAIHLAAAVALFGVVRRTLLSAPLRQRFGAEAGALSLAVAHLWVVHPLHTEAVTYLVQRVESLMGLFALLALYCAIRAGDGARPLAWGAAAVASYALALGSKEGAMVLPLVVIAWDRVFLTGDAPPHEVWRRRWPLYVAFATTSLLLVFTANGVRSRSVGFWLDGWTPWTYLLTQSRVIVHYLRLAFWPSPLVLDPYWPAVRSFQEAAWSMAGLSALLVLTAVGVARRRPAAFAGACFCLLLAPTSSVLPVVTEVAAEHRMYLPLAAVVSMAIVGLLLAWRLLLARLGGRGRFRAAPVAAAAMLVVAAIALGLATRARNLDYGSDEHIWRDTIAKDPQNPRARAALGADLVSAGRYEEAEAELQTSLALAPDRAETLSNLRGGVRARKGGPEYSSPRARGRPQAGVRRRAQESRRRLPGARPGRRGRGAAAPRARGTAGSCRGLERPRAPAGREFRRCGERRWRGVVAGAACGRTDLAAGPGPAGGRGSRVCRTGTVRRGGGGHARGDLVVVDQPGPWRHACTPARGVRLAPDRQAGSALAPLRPGRAAHPRAPWISCSSDPRRALHAQHW
jgi:protein O-mannosyl-transferase